MNTWSVMKELPERRSQSHLARSTFHEHLQDDVEQRCGCQGGPQTDCSHTTAGGSDEVGKRVLIATHPWRDCHILCGVFSRSPAQLIVLLSPHFTHGGGAGGESEPVINYGHDRPGQPGKKRDHELERGPTGSRSSNARQLGCVSQDMKPPKLILRKSSDMQKPIQRVNFTKAIARHTKIRDQISFARIYLPRWTSSA